jgi:hypothetical protein
MSLQLNRIDLKNGTDLGSVSSINNLRTEYELFGGVDSASFVIPTKWDTNFTIEQGDGIRIIRDAVPIFFGVVSSVEPSISSDEITVSAYGMRTFIDEMKIMDDSTPNLLFGDPTTGISNVRTVYELVNWIVDNVLEVNAPNLIFRDHFIEPTNSTKFGNAGFVINQTDKLSAVLDILATMDDAIWGVSSTGGFYFLPRESAESVTLTKIHIGKDVPDNWRSQKIGVLVSGRVVQSRRAPSYISIDSRDYLNSPGARVYRMSSIYGDDVRKVAKFKAPNIRSGQGARRLARGYFSRFTAEDITVEDLSFIVSAKRYEPFLGAIEVYNVDNLLTRQLAGKISVDWGDSISVSADLGETSMTPGSGNPITDPLYTEPDTRGIIDTGDSGEIDFDDGFDGDGDDLHSNPDRYDAGDGAGMDYGSDRSNEQTGGGSSSGVRLARITEAGSGTFSVEVYKIYDAESVDFTLSNVPIYPIDAPRPEVGQAVFIAYLDAATPYVMGVTPSRGLILRVVAVGEPGTYNVDVLSPVDNEVIGTFENCNSLPEGGYFTPGDIVFGHWLNGENKPRLILSAGAYSDHYYFVGQVIKD